MTEADIVNNIDAGLHIHDTAGGDDKLPSGKVTRVFEKPHGFVRHTLYIYNPNAFDIKLLPANSTSGRGLTIKAKSSKTFEFHAIAQVPHFDAEGKLLYVEQLGHCEWPGEVWIYHTGGSDADLEALEVF